MGGKYGAGETDDTIDKEGKDEEVINDFAFQYPIYEQHGPARKHVEEQHATANAAGVCQFAQQTNAKGDDGGLQQIGGHDQLAAKEIVDIKLEEQNEIDACQIYKKQARQMMEPRSLSPDQQKHACHQNHTEIAAGGKIDQSLEGMVAHNV